MAVFGNVWLYSAAAFVIGVVLTWLFWVMPLQRRLHAVQREMRRRAGAPAAATPEPAAEAHTLDELLAYPDDQDDPALAGHGVGIGGTGLFVASRTGLEQAPAPGARHDITQELPVPESWQPADLDDDEEDFPQRGMSEFGESYGMDGYPSIADALNPDRAGNGTVEAAEATTVFEPFADAGEDYGRTGQEPVVLPDEWVGEGAADSSDGPETQVSPLPRREPRSFQNDKDTAYLAFLSQQYESGDAAAGEQDLDLTQAGGTPSGSAAFNAADLPGDGDSGADLFGDDLFADSAGAAGQPAPGEGAASGPDADPHPGGSMDETVASGAESGPEPSHEFDADDNQRSLFEPVVDTGIPLDDDLPDPRRLRNQQGELDLTSSAGDADGDAGMPGEPDAATQLDRVAAAGPDSPPVDAADDAPDDAVGPSSGQSPVDTRAADDGVPAGPFGKGSALPQPDGGPPSAAFTVKARTSSMVFHTPTSPFYDRLLPQVWFRTAEDALGAGFTSWERPKS